MATANVTSAHAVLQFPKVIPSVEPITQAELRELIEFQNLRVQLEERISSIESSMKARLESGAAVESGTHIASLKESFRRNVSWKLIVVRLASRLGLDGDAYASNVIVHTKPTRTVAVEVR